MTNRVKRYDGVITLEQRQAISKRYKRITKVINSEFWNLSSDTKNSFYVGSYGRGTAISTSDIDILVNLPKNLFDNYNNLSGNGQSRLLQAIRTALIQTYPNSDIRADGQIVKIRFSDGILFEILPAFQKLDGTYIYPNTNSEKNISSNGLLVATCQHMRYIRDNHFKSYKLSGIVIDSFVFHAMKNWKFVSEGESSSAPGSYEQILLDYFNENAFLWDIISLRAPGSQDEVETKKSIDCLEKVLKYMVG